MKRTFNKVGVDIPYEYPSNQSPGELVPGEGKGMLKEFAEKAEQNMNESGKTTIKREPNYEQAKQMIGKKVIQDMLTVLVEENWSHKRIGRDFMDKPNVARDLLVDAEYKIPSETFSTRQDPMAFFFDYSGSCNDYVDMFSEIAAGLTQKGAVTYIGGNGYVDYRIDVAPSNVSPRMVRQLNRGEEVRGVKIVEMDCSLPEAMKRDKVTHLFAYTDYDSCREMVQASNYTDVIWFSAQKGGGDFGGLDDFKGRYFLAHSIDEIKKNLKHLDDKNYEAACRQRQKDSYRW